MKSPPQTLNFMEVVPLVRSTMDCTLDIESNSYIYELIVRYILIDFQPWALGFHQFSGFV